MSAKTDQMFGYRDLEIGLVRPSGHNPRQTFEDGPLQELAASIKAKGILEPLIVRPLEDVAGEAAGVALEKPKEKSDWVITIGVDGHGRCVVARFPYDEKEAAFAALELRRKARFEIVAGERRYRAAKVAGLAKLPCIVRELSDVEALEVAVLENLQREDVPALEEAEGFRQLIALGKYKPEDLAAKIGKSRSHVMGRLRLAKLSEPVKKALAAGRIDPTVALLLAKFEGEKLQKEALEEVIPDDWEFKETGAMRFLQAKERLRQFWPEIKSHLWKLDDAELAPGPGACATCPKYSANMLDVGDLALPKGANVCTDRRCFALKLLAFRRRFLAKKQAAGETVLPDPEWERVIGKGYSHDRPAGNCGYVASDDACRQHRDFESWEVLLAKSDVKPVWTMTAQGHPLRLYVEKEAREWLSKHGRIRAEAGPGASPVERASVIRENKIKKAVTAAVAEACEKKVQELGLAAFACRMLCLLAGNNGTASAWNRLVGLKGWPEAGKLSAALEKLADREWRKVVVQGFVVQSDGTPAPYAVQRLAEVLGVDEGPIEKAARVAFKESEKTKQPAGKSAKKGAKA